MRMIARNEGFVCGNCGRDVAPVKYGGSYRNHCPYCLFSKHVDSDTPGDRASQCWGLMEPVGVFTRKSGEYVIVHRCVSCGFERFNRVAGDDDFDLVVGLSSVSAKKGGYVWRYMPVDILVGRVQKEILVVGGRGAKGSLGGS